MAITVKNGGCQRKMGRAGFGNLKAHWIFARGAQDAGLRCKFPGGHAAANHWLPAWPPETLRPIFRLSQGGERKTGERGILGGQPRRWLRKRREKRNGRRGRLAAAETKARGVGSGKPKRSEAAEVPGTPGMVRMCGGWIDGRAHERKRFGKTREARGTRAT